MFSIFNKPVIIPPVSVWGTLLETKATIAKNKIQSEVNYGLHLAAAKSDELKKGMKSSSEEKKQKKEEKKQKKQTSANTEENGEVVDVEFTEVPKEDSTEEKETSSEVEPTEEKETKSSILNQDEDLTQGVTYGPDFSEFIEDEEPEEKPVTQADLDAALKKMHENSIK